jgi:hypothetical protein
MAAKKKKPVCAVCRNRPKCNGDLCWECDESYENWLTKKKGSSLAWASGRTREIVLAQVRELLKEIP